MIKLMLLGTLVNVSLVVLFFYLYQRSKPPSVMMLLLVVSALLQLTACGKESGIISGQITPWSQVQQESFVADCTAYNEQNQSQSPVLDLNAQKHGNFEEQFCACLMINARLNYPVVSFSSGLQSVMGQAGYNNKCVAQVTIQVSGGN